MNMLRKCLFTICLSAISWGSSCEAAALTPDVEAVRQPPFLCSRHVSPRFIFNYEPRFLQTQ